MVVMAPCRAWAGRACSLCCTGIPITSSLLWVG